MSLYPLYFKKCVKYFKMFINCITIYLPNTNNLYPNIIDTTEGTIVIHFLKTITTKKIKINFFFFKEKKKIIITYIHKSC
jgi:hypothetical protein